MAASAVSTSQSDAEPHPLALITSVAARFFGSIFLFYVWGLLLLMFLSIVLPPRLPGAPELDRWTEPLTSLSVMVILSVVYWLPLAPITFLPLSQHQRFWWLIITIAGWQVVLIGSMASLRARGTFVFEGTHFPFEPWELSLVIGLLYAIPLIHSLQRKTVSRAALATIFVSALLFITLQFTVARTDALRCLIFLLATLTLGMLCSNLLAKTDRLKTEMQATFFVLWTMLLIAFMAYESYSQVLVPNPVNLDSGIAEFIAFFCAGMLAPFFGLLGLYWPSENRLWRVLMLVPAMGIATLALLSLDVGGSENLVLFLWENYNGPSLYFL